MGLSMARGILPSQAMQMQCQECEDLKSLQDVQLKVTPTMYKKFTQQQKSNNAGEVPTSKKNVIMKAMPLLKI